MAVLSAAGRKVLSILSALEVQIEDDGDSPTVNEHLLASVRKDKHCHMKADHH